MTCYYCFADQTMVDDVNNRRCTYCEKELKPIKPESTAEEHVFIYVDDSNMWIEAKKLAAVKSKLKCVEDPRLRLDIGKVTDVVANSREVVLGTLYGSEPPPVDTVWHKIRSRGWKVVTNQRSTYTNKEKQVDHQMVADITALVSDRSVAKGKVVIVSGDADMIPAIKESLKRKWPVEIWMWESSISNSLVNLATDNPELVKVSPLSSSLEAVTFTNSNFGDKEIPMTRSAVITNIDFSPDEQWQKNLIEKLGWPFQISLRGSEVDYEDIILIFANVKSVNGKDFEKIFHTIFENLEQEYPGKVVNYHAYLHVEIDKRTDICFANKYEALVNEELNANNTSNEDQLLKNGDELHENGAGFQVVAKKKSREKKKQQYSQQCRSRSKCKSGLDCKYYHTEGEKKFFNNPRKDKECFHKGHCKYGSARCYFAHSDEDSFCRNCHRWGHLQGNCMLK